MSKASREVYLIATKKDCKDFRQHCIDYMHRSRRGFHSSNDYLFYLQCM